VRVIQGFDYRDQKPVERTPKEWRAQLGKLLESGGFRRVAHGETFGHCKRGLIQFEIYGKVNAQ
jgi:hypothetical protein